MLVIEGIDPGEVESVEIYDTAGMKLLEEKKITSAGTLQTNLVNGIYVVIIKAKEEIHNRKISLR